jgi:hypothetical protein
MLLVLRTYDFPTILNSSDPSDVALDNQAQFQRPDQSNTIEIASFEQNVFRWWGGEGVLSWVIKPV